MYHLPLGINRTDKSDFVDKVIVPQHCMIVYAKKFVVFQVIPRMVHLPCGNICLDVSFKFHCDKRELLISTSSRRARAF